MDDITFLYGSKQYFKTNINIIQIDYVYNPYIYKDSKVSQ